MIVDAEVPRSAMSPNSAYVSTVASNEGADVSAMFAQFEKHLKHSTAVESNRSPLDSELRSLFAECNTPDWDSDGALPVSRRTLSVAMRLVGVLPKSVPLPEVSCAVDGSIVFDWMPTQGRMISVSIHESDRLAFAWLNGTDRGHAVARFNGADIPTIIMSTIQSILEGDNARVLAA